MDVNLRGFEARLRAEETSRSASATPNVGQRLRTLRRERFWTLLQASEHTGLSLSALSKIERGDLSPTLSSLGKIAAGFGIDVVTLLAEAEAAPPAQGRRSINRQRDGRSHHTATCRNTWLGADLRNKRMLPFRTRVTARDPAEYAEWQTHDGEIFVYVLKGTLIVHSVLYEPVGLKADDSMYYDASSGTKWTADGETDAEVLWVYA